MRTVEDEEAEKVDTLIDLAYLRGERRLELLEGIKLRLCEQWLRENTDGNRQP